MIDGEPINIAPEEDPGDNNAVYKVHLTKGQVLTVSYDGKMLGFYIYNEELHEPILQAYNVTCGKDGTYTLYINKQNQIYISYVADPVEDVYALYVNGVVTSDYIRRLDPGEDKAVFEIELAEGDTLRITLNGVDLKLGESDYVTFTCVTSGTHVVYVNSVNQVYIEEPVRMLSLQIQINITWWSNDGALTYVYYWSSDNEHMTTYPGVEATYNETYERYVVSIPVASTKVICSLSEDQ